MDDLFKSAKKASYTIWVSYTRYIVMGLLILSFCLGFAWRSDDTIANNSSSETITHSTQDGDSTGSQNSSEPSSTLEDGAIASTGVNGKDSSNGFIYESQGEESISIKETCIDISGAVNKPGLICAGKEARLATFISQAGGINYKSAALSWISRNLNVAIVPTDGSKVYIPYLHEQECHITDGREGGEVKTPKDKDKVELSCVDINVASQEDLEGLTGVGSTTAVEIIKGRPYTSLEDLLGISGIGQSKYDGLIDDLCQI